MVEKEKETNKTLKNITGFIAWFPVIILFIILGFLAYKYYNYGNMLNQILFLDF